VAGLRPPFDDAMGFFRRALEHKVMTVPGPFFDVNPGKRRPGPSPLRQWVRFSFGPPEDNVRLGLDRLERMLAEG
jgi:aspartate/methionine/tyrosine aminotransferase